MSRRAFVIVIDACGVGELPDAVDYGDGGANTLAHVAAAVGGLRVPGLAQLGLGSIIALDGVPAAVAPVLHGRLHALGPGKDSTAGHWELMGVVAEVAPPTYPEGLPSELVAAIEAAIGRPVICNLPYNGIAAIDDFGGEHVRSGRVIIYTSQDSVVQLAAHVDVLGTDELYAACEAVRELMQGDHAVGRVIARPFEGAPGAFARTLGRRDYVLAPPSRSYVDELAASGCPVHAVGKVADLFPQVEFAGVHAGATNGQALTATDRLFDELPAGLVFTNLIETDQRFGHRKDTDGFHAALREIDAALGSWLGALGPDDLLVITADHGCDPQAPHTEHTREHVPLLASFPGHGGRRHDGPMADVGASVLRWLAGREAADLPGKPFV